MRCLITLVSAAAIVTLSGPCVSAQEKPLDGRHALVIGNAAYPDSAAPLKDAVNDARAMAKELRRNRFDVEIGENLSKIAMQAALDRLYAKVKAGATTVIFFSGFGIQSNRQSYMTPVDAQIWTENDLRRDGFSMDKILRELNAKGATIKVAILNASRPNPYERRFRVTSEGLAPAVTPRNTLVIYSAAPGTIVRAAAAEQSLFVTELIKEMQTPGLAGEDVFNRARFGVARASRDEQTPWVSSSLAVKFSFDPNAPAEPRPEAAKTPAAKPASESFPAAKKTDVAKAPAPPPAATPDPGKPAAAKPKTEGWPTAKLDPPSASPKPATPPAKVKKNDEAIRELDQRLKRHPSDLDARYKRGTLYAQNGDYALAVKDFDVLIRAKPDHADALNNRCWARIMLNELQAAVRDCDEALRIRPEFANALDSRGLLRLKLGQPATALADFDASLRINARQASSLYGRGIARMRTGNTAAGTNDIDAAKSINPRIAEEFSSYGIR